MVCTLKVNSTQHEYNTAVAAGYEHIHITVYLYCTGDVGEVIDMLLACSLFSYNFLIQKNVQTGK